MSFLTDDSKEIAKDGWASYVEEFTKNKHYIQENGSNGFLDANGQVITIKAKAKK